MAFVVVLISACDPGPGPSPSFAPFSFHIPFTFKPASTPPDTSAVEAVVALVGGTANQPGLLDNYWTGAIADVPNSEAYRRPVSVTSYPPNHPINTACIGDEELGPKWNENAYFCSSDETISWEREWFASMSNEIGELAAVAVLAHEWGHHIQNLSQKPPAKLSSEDQADCYSGSFLSYAQDQGLLDVYFPTGSITDAVLQTYLTGNSKFVQSEWYSTYGPPRSRFLAFDMGALALSPSACSAYQGYEYRDATKLDWYSLDVPAGFSITEQNGVQFLTGTNVTAQVKVLPELDSTSAASLFEAAAADWFSDSTFNWSGSGYDAPFSDRLGGTSYVRGYEQQVTSADGSTRPIHGELVLQADAGHGGILIDTYVDGAAPATQDGWDQVNQWVAIVANGLCPGGQGTAICPTAGVR